jgi:hypothetical protein
MDRHQAKEIRACQIRESGGACRGMATGAIIRMCSCEGQSLPIHTNGLREWAYCPHCGQRFDVSADKLPNPPF